MMLARIVSRRGAKTQRKQTGFFASLRLCEMILIFSLALRSTAPTPTHLAQWQIVTVDSKFSVQQAVAVAAGESRLWEAMRPC